MSLHVIATKNWRVIETCERSLRVVLVSDESELGSLPDQVVAAADLGSSADMESVVRGDPPGGADGMFVWFAGERLRQGNAASLRRCFVGTPSRSFVPVHLPCLGELDLISLQPRLVAGGAATDRIWSNIRIDGNPHPAEGVRAILERIGEPWARLHLALLTEMACPGAGVEVLEKLRREKAWHPSLASLVLRNLAVLMLRHDRASAAESLLRKGLELFPRYAELHYISALLAARKQSVGEVAAHLRRATKGGDITLVGSGGERSYRSHWLLARTLETQGVQPPVAIHYLSGLRARPAFEPSVVGLLRQRLSYEKAYALRQELCQLARRERRYLEPVFYFLLLHRQLKSAARILETFPMEEEVRSRYARDYEAVASTFLHPQKLPGRRPGVLLTGPFQIVSSFARVNCKLAVSLLAVENLEVALEPHGEAQISLPRIPRGELILQGFYRRPQHCDLTIRHHWPPSFRRPDAGKLACIVPWEYGAVPVRWVEQIERNVAELWVPSEFVRGVFARGGVRPERIRIIPNGVDAAVYRPEGEKWRPAGASGFLFLFVGGAIERKGLDVLTKAYSAAFNGADNVTLVIKEQGSSTFYRNSKLLAEVERLARRRRGARIVLLTDELSDERLAALYRTADVFVLPYRGEGFGMPLAEALACGTPVITTGLGPAREFCPPDSSWFVDAQEVTMPCPPSHLGKLANDCTWFEPSAGHLEELMRRAFDRRDGLRENREKTSQQILKNLSWDTILPLFRERILALTSAD